MRLREEQENILPNIRRLPVHRKTLHDARAQSEGIKPFIVSHLFSI